MNIDLSQATERVAEVAREHATRVDAEASFPTATVDAAREAGLLGLISAEAVGCHGGGPRELQQVGRGVVGALRPGRVEPHQGRRRIVEDRLGEDRGADVVHQAEGGDLGSEPPAASAQLAQQGLARGGQRLSGFPSVPGHRQSDRYGAHDSRDRL